MFSKIHEECGVFGIYSSGGTDVAGLTYSALFALQHRGQESCGIAVNDDGVISGYKDLGLVGEVFPPERLQKLGGGQLAVGHVRYATTGRKSRENAQPLIINHIKGSMALAHNGNLTNAAELREALELNGAIFHTTSDTEVIAYTITNERLRVSSIEDADKILVMDGGQIVAMGTHDELLKTCDIYRETYESQMKGGSDNEQ